MIKPERMSRIAIVGPRNKLGVTIQCLYELDLFHLVDYLEEDPAVKIGHPLPQAEELSKRLLRLRSILRALHLEEYKTERTVPVEEIEQMSDQATVTLELEATKKTEGRQAQMSRLRELNSENETLSLFKEIGLPLSVYSPSEAISFVTGVASQPIADNIKALGVDTEVIEAPRREGCPFAVFFRTKDSEAVQQILAGAGYQETKPPFTSGTAQERIAANEKEIEKLESALSKEDEEIEALREKYAPFVLAAEEHYAIEVLKAETPLRVATTENSFTVDGWVPKESTDTIKEAVAKEAGDTVTVEPLTVSKREENEEAPVKLRHSRVVRPFQMFVEMMSTPLYREFDPTLPIFIVFPLFFGLMIGDLGFGALLMVFGALFYFKFGKDSEGWRNLGYVTFAGGLIAALLGMFVFGEALGLPFHQTEAYPLSWDSMGINIPIPTAFERMISVGDFLALSVIVGWVHLTFGLILGILNELKVGKREAATKVVWFVVLQAISFQLFLVGAGMHNHISMFMVDTIAAPFAASTIMFSGIQISMLTLVMLLACIVGFIVLNGKHAGMELLEILSMFTNVVSYTRIAAFSVAHGATAYAFNSIVATNFMGGDILMAVMGIVVLFLLQLIQFALGSLSCGIQAIRLNYVEFFMKFFKGGGVSFEPLGYKRKHSTKTEV